MRIQDSGGKKVLGKGIFTLTSSIILVIVCTISFLLTKYPRTSQFSIQILAVSTVLSFVIPAFKIFNVLSMIINMILVLIASPGRRIEALGKYLGVERQESGLQKFGKRLPFIGAIVAKKIEETYESDVLETFKRYLSLLLPLVLFYIYISLMRSLTFNEAVQKGPVEYVVYMIQNFIEWVKMRW